MKFFKKHSQFFILLFCILVGFFLRVYNFNWDQGLLFHPDERNISNAVTKIHFFSQLNPGFFAYGGFSIYLYRATCDILVLLTKDSSWVNDWGKIDDIGRIFSALFFTFTNLSLFFLAKKIFSKTTALLSCFFYIFTVALIQNAHYATTESSITFFGVLLCLLSVIWLEKPTILKSILLGIIYGISLATKTSAALIIIFPTFAILIFILKHRKLPKKILSLTSYILLFAISSVLFFLLLSPYTVLDFKDFSASMNYEGGVVTGSLPVVYTYQFNGTVPYLFQIVNFIWQLGPPLTIFAVIGFILIVLEPLKKKEARKIIFWIFPLIYFLYVGSWHTKFLRYMVPIVPFLIISGSYLLFLIQKLFRIFGNILISLTLITTVIWAISFFTIYTRPQTRISASYWFYQNAKIGSRVLTEAWDDGLPVTVGNFNPSAYPSKQLDMYSPDGPQKIIYLSTMLSNADYIILNSRRLYGTLIRLIDQYPITSKYYKLLFTGKLGYKIVGVFSSYPQLFGIQINDDVSEETFQVYEHPKVIIFKNEKYYSQSQLMKIILN